MSGEKVMLTTAATTAQTVGLGTVLLPLAAPVLVGVAVWGLSRWLSSQRERSQRQAQEAEKLRTPIRDLEREFNQRLQQQHQEFQAAVQEVNKRQEEALQSEEERLRTILKKGQAEQRNEYMQILKNQRQEYTQLLAQQERKFNDLIVAERQEREQRQQFLQQQINALVQSTQKQAEYAQNMLADVESVWASIDQNYQHQRFAPGRLENLKRELVIARSNIESGLTQASVAITQKTYLELVDLRNELERKEQEWLLLYNNARTNLGILLAQVEANKQCEVRVAEDSQGESFSIDVNYWSNGNLSRYEQELKQFEAQLQQGETTLTVDEVRAIAEQIISLEPRLAEILEQAKQTIVASQLRAEIADRVVEVLESMGYRLEDYERDTAYEGNDQRAAYMVKVKNIAGDEIVMLISPDKEFGVNSISINTFSQTFVDEKATQQNAQAVFTALGEVGIQGVGNIECRQEAKQEYRDLDAVRQRQSPSLATGQS